MFKLKEQKRELKAINMNKKKELYCKTRDLYMKEVLELNEKSVLKPEFKKLLFKYRIYEIKAIKCQNATYIYVFHLIFRKYIIIISKFLKNIIINVKFGE